MNVVGHIDGIVGQGISGWVCRPANLEIRLWVELLVDNCIMGVALAENYHPEAKDYGDGCYGFWLHIPPIVQENGGCINVRIANTYEEFAPVVYIEEQKAAPSLLGEIASDIGLSVSGWAIDASYPSKILTISASVNGKEIVQTIANQCCVRPEHANGHGFHFSLPMDLADGREHLIDIRDEEQRALPGSPIQICVTPQGLSTWLAGQKQLTPQKKEFLLSSLHYYESRLPKSTEFTIYPDWKKVFSSPSTVTSKTIHVGICVIGELTQEMEQALLAQYNITYTVYTYNACSSNLKNLSIIGDTENILRIAADRHDFIALIDGTSLLYPKSLTNMVHELQKHRYSLVYADEDILYEKQYIPICKPVWDTYLYLEYDYLGPIVFSSALVNKIKNFNELNYKIRTQLILNTEAQNIGHIPYILSRRVNNKENLIIQEKERRYIIQHWLDTNRPGAYIETHAKHEFLSRVQWPLTKKIQELPLVSIVIPTRDKHDILKICLDSLKTSTYQNIEIIIVDNASIEPETLELLKKERQTMHNGVTTKVLQWTHYFNYASINNYAAQEASGALICFLNNDTQILSPHWLEEMVSLLINNDDIGCVGAKLVWPNNLVQHGGVIIGTHGLASHVGNHWLADEDGYMYRNLVIQQWSAVTAACLLTPKKLFLESGGFDAVMFPVAFNDVDYCLRVRELGKKIVWTPYACIAHYESASRGKDVSPMNKKRAEKEMRNFRTRWGNYEDPFYNPNLSLSVVCEPFTGLALPPRARSIR